MEEVKSGSLVRLSLRLDGFGEEFNLNKASLFHGVLMELIDEDYADEMHGQGLKPFSQHLVNNSGKVVWNICTLSDAAYEHIIKPLADENFTEFELKHNNMTVKVIEKELISIQIDDMLKDFYSEDASSIFRIEFNTPTAFKRDGKYLFYPEIYNIYSSLMRRFDEVTDRGNMFNWDTLDQITDNTEIVGYSLHSVRFNLEGVRIPAFMGSITIKLHGSQTMKNFAKLLFRFGEYSGIGIKTALGMGSISINEKEGSRNDRKRD